jgi:hypothetical protein
VSRHRRQSAAAAAREQSRRARDFRPGELGAVTITPSRVITAKYAGTCPDCDKPIVVGEVVAWAPGRPARHRACYGTTAVLLVDHPKRPRQRGYATSTPPAIGPGEPVVSVTSTSRGHAAHFCAKCRRPYLYSGSAVCGRC